MDSLVIVESPTKEKTIGKILSKGFVVKSTFGHIRDLPQRKLGVNVDKQFEPTYLVLPKAKKIIQQLNVAARQAKTVYLATDYDREGEAIAWHLTHLLRCARDKFRRITFHEITAPAIQEAINTPRKVDTDLVDAQVARRILDRLVGYKLSPLLWKTVRRGLSAGRVQSVAVRLICQREEEIEKFTAQEYWTLEAEFEKSGHPRFWTGLHAFEGRRIDRLALGDKASVDRILADIEGDRFSVLNVDAKEKRRQPGAPYTTASLQQDAAQRLGFRTQKTMIVAQQLYEGIAIGEAGQVGLITYMRTDSAFVAKTAQNEAAAYIDVKFGKTFLPPKPRVFKTKTKAAQEAHEAIRPTSVMREPETLRKHLTPEQLRLYRLIWERFVASQMADAVYDTVAADIGGKKSSAVFRATGRTLRFAGFLALQVAPDAAAPAEDGDRDAALPPLKKGEGLEKTALRPEQHFTEPPPRFNEASLVKALETQGIGRPSTYSPIIQTIVNRGYVRFEERRLHPTDLGRIVDTQLLENFKEIVDVKFTADMEERLDEVAAGKAGWQAVLGDFWKPFSKQLERAATEMRVTKVQPTPSGVPCGACEAELVVRESRFGRFLACPRYPACKYKVSLDKSGQIVRPEATDETCEQCGKNLVVRHGRRGKFLACSGYPACKYTRSLVVENKVEEKTGENCPNCGKEMVVKNGRFGPFIACSGYPQCKTIKKKEAA